MNRDLRPPLDPLKQKPGSQLLARRRGLTKAPNDLTEQDLEGQSA